MRLAGWLLTADRLFRCDELQAILRLVETPQRATWLYLCGVAGGLLASLPVIALRSTADEPVANLILLAGASLGGYLVGRAVAERKLPQRGWFGGRQAAPSKDRAGAYLLVYAGLLAVLFGGLFVVGFPSSLPAPLNMFEFYIVIFAGLALGQGIVEAWALAHPGGKVAQL